MLALLLAALTISDPVPVQVDPFKNTSHKKKLDAVGEDLTDAVRRALNASGHFVVVRSDLVDQVAKAQAKSLSAMFKDDGPSAGRFTRAKVLVRGAYKERSKNKLAIQVSFVDMGSLESLPKLDFAIVVPTEDADAMFTGVATRVAEKTSVAVGASPQRIDAEAKKQIALAARSAKDTVAMEKYREGRRLIAHHGIDAALKAKDAFEAALQIDPEYVPAMVELIRVEHFLANYARWIGEPWTVGYARLLHARDLAAKALELEPEFNTLHRELARVFLAMEDLELYKEELAKAKALMPSDPEVLLIEASGETSDDRKRALLEKVIALDPSNIEARYRHSALLAREGDVEGADKELVFILKKLDPQHVFSKIDLAIDEYLAGRAQRSVLLLEQAKKTEPRIGLIDWNLAFAKDALGKDGEPFLGEGLARCSEALLRDLRSATEESDELFAKRLAKFAAATRARPDRVLVGFDYASTLVSSKQTKEIELGVEQLRKLLERAVGKNTRLIIRYVLASALMRLGKHEEAQSILADLASTLKTRAIRERMQLELADSLMDTGKTARARAELSRLVKDAELADMRIVAANRLGASYRNEGNFDLAVRYFQQALDVSEDYWTHYEIAQTFEAQRASDLRRLEKMTVQVDRDATQILIDAASMSALAEYNASVKLYQGNAIVFAHLGALAWSLGQQDLAIGSYRRAAKLDLKYALDLALTYARNGRLPDAEIELNAMIAEDPTNARLVALKGELYGALKFDDHAAAAFHDAFQLDPTWDYARNAAFHFKRAKKFDQAIEILHVAMQKMPAQASSSWSQLGHVEHARKDEQKALAAHQEARKLSPNHPGIEVNIGMTLRRLGKLEEAERTLEAVLMGNETYERAYIELARVYKAQNSTPQAIKVLEKGAAKLPTSRKIRLALVRLDRPHAVARLAKLEQEDTTFWRYPALRARFLAEDGKPSDALFAYGRALELAPSNKRLYAAFAALLEKRGALNEAFSAYAMASYLDPGDARLASAKTSLRAKGAKLVLLPVMPPEFIRDVIAVVRAAEATREAKREAPKKQPKAVNVPSQT